MTRIASPLLAALAAATMALAPTVAEARDHRGGGRHDGRGYDRGHDDRGRYDGRGYGGRGYDRDYRYGRDNDDDDALAAGVIGLALGAVIGSALSQPRQSYYQPRYAPPPAYYPPPPPPAYYPGPSRPYYDGGYRTSQPTCVLRERQWDPYAGQYVRVERRIPC